MKESSRNIIRRCSRLVWWPVQSLLSWDANVILPLLFPFRLSLYGKEPVDHTPINDPEKLLKNAPWPRLFTGNDIVKTTMCTVILRKAIVSLCFRSLLYPYFVKIITTIYQTFFCYFFLCNFFREVAHCLRRCTILKIFQNCLLFKILLLFEVIIWNK